MRRLHLVEMEDLAICPPFLRDAATDFLRRAQQLVNPYLNIAPVLAGALADAKADRIVDLCSGAGGPLEALHPRLEEILGKSLGIVLTDRFPSNRKGIASLPYHPDPVDATRIDRALGGFRTMFTAFHHFEPAQAGSILANAASEGVGIGIFEVTGRTLVAFATVLAVSLLPFLCTPFLRPAVPLRQYLFTYVLPLIPLLLLWDGMVSNLRSYSPDEMRSLLPGQDLAQPYNWDIGTARGPLGITVTYLIGVPQSR